MLEADATVIKDAGDDPDVTNGMQIKANVAVPFRFDDPTPAELGESTNASEEKGFTIPEVPMIEIPPSIPRRGLKVRQLHWRYDKDCRRFGNQSGDFGYHDRKSREVGRRQSGYAQQTGDDE